MSDSFVTQCPHCQTSFRVSHAQLSVARGVVRCGACLQVFNAAQQLLNSSTETEQPPVVATPEPEAVEPNRNLPGELRLGYLDITFQAEEPPVLRKITVRSRRFIEALEALSQQLAIQIGGADGL